MEANYPKEYGDPYMGETDPIHTDSELADMPAITAPDESAEITTAYHDFETTDLTPEDVRADMFASYEAFEPAVNALRESLSTIDNPEDHPDWLGSGSRAHVFAVDHEGSKYAVRIPKDSQANSHHLDSRIAAGIAGKGIPRLEQTLAVSYGDGYTTVSEIIPGKHIGLLSEQEIVGVTHEQLGELVDTLRLAYNNNVCIDPKPSNIILDAQEGFGIVDYRAANNGQSAYRDLGEVVSDIAFALSSAGDYDRPNTGTPPIPDTDPAYYADYVVNLQARSVLLQKYREVAAATLTGNDCIVALAGIEEHLENTRRLAADYADPAWVARTIAERNEFFERQAAVRASMSFTPSGYQILDVI